MSKQSLITQEIQAMVGKVDIFASPEELGRASISKFVAAVGDTNPLYWDDEFAEKTRYGGVISPPTMVFELNHNLRGGISEEDGGYLDKVNLPPPLTRFIRGGNEYLFFQPVRPEDKITSKRKVSRIYEKKGKASNLVFVIIHIKYYNQKSELLGINKETLIFMPE